MEVFWESTDAGPCWVGRGGVLEEKHRLIFAVGGREKEKERDGTRG